MMPLTVACVFVKGPFPYTPGYVIRLERMARRYITRPFTFVCLTDNPIELAVAVGRARVERGWHPDIHSVPIESLAGIVPDNGVGYWNKIRLFDPSIGLTGRVLFLDLDTLLVGGLDDIIDFPASFASTTDVLIVERGHLDTDRYGRRIVRRFNTSVIVFDAGTYPELFTEWTPAIAQDFSTDQDWIGWAADGAIGMPYGWFPRISRVQPPWPPEAKVILVKKPKNAICAQQWPWFEPMWGGWQ